MRDGAELNATLYLPKEKEAAGRTPVIFTLTPYIADDYHERGAYFATHGYSFASVDARGRGNSGGEFVTFVNEGRDGHDVVEWLAQQPFCDGHVAMWGGSYAGFDQWSTAKELPPHLSTIVPAAAVHPGVDAPFFSNIGQPYVVRWLTLTNGHTAQNKLFADNGYWRAKFLAAYRQHIPFKSLDTFTGTPFSNFQRFVQHPARDAYYDALTPSPEQFKKIRIPILTITGQNDDDEFGALTYYRDHLRNGATEAVARHYLIIGPWDHPGTRTPTDEVEGVKFGSAALLDLNDLHRQWYDWTTKKGPKPAFLKKQVAYYLLAAGNTGANGEWRYSDSFAELTSHTRPFYLDSKNGDANGAFHSGSLGESRPTEGADTFTYDPLDTGRGESLEAPGAESKAFLLDQRYALRIAQDGLVYHTAPLPGEAELVGCPNVRLWVSLDTPDTDLQVRVPTGYARIEQEKARKKRNRERNDPERRDGGKNSKAVHRNAAAGRAARLEEIDHRLVTTRRPPVFLVLIGGEPQRRRATPDADFVTVAGREMPRKIIVIGRSRRVHIGAMIEQPAHGAFGPLHRRDMQWREPAVAARVHHLESGLEQNIQVMRALLRRVMQRVHPVLVHRENVRVRRDQFFSRLVVRHEQRRAPAVVRRFQARTMFQNLRRPFDVAVRRCPMQRGHPKRPARLDARPVCQKQFDNLPMSLLASFNRKKQQWLVVRAIRPGAAGGFPFAEQGTRLRDFTLLHRRDESPA